MPNPNFYLCANYNLNFGHHVFKLICFSFCFKSTDLNRLHFWEFQASRFCSESHGFSASLTVSRPHKLISWAVHFTVWRSTDAILMVQVMLISYLHEWRMWCYVGNGQRILLTSEEGGMFIHINSNCVSESWCFPLSEVSLACETT